MTPNEKADILLRSNNIFTAADIQLTDGYVAIKDNLILSVGTGDGSAFTAKTTEIYELGTRVVCPGFSDVHCFFTGYALGFAGADLNKAHSVEEVIQILKTSPPFNESLILGRGWNSEIIDLDGSRSLEEAFGYIPVILFEKTGETCWMNNAAIERYHFTPDTCYPEAYWRLVREILGNRDFILPKFKHYMSMLNRRGVTSVKEMGFDNFYGFVDILEELEQLKELTLRVSFMSQPVSTGIDLEYGRKMRERFQGDFVRFSGYNRMTDGSISQLCGDLKKPYACAPDICCAQAIDYDLIEAETLAADAESFRFSLHAQGDAAIHKVLNIYEKCKRDPKGKLIHRHSITDLEFSDPEDLERMGRLGVLAEIYPQIQSISDRSGKLAMIEEKIGTDRGRYYWNRRKMADSGVLLSCATDLPLLIPDIPESFYHACGAWFPEGGESFNQENALTISEILLAWTKGGAYNLYCEETLGTLEAGKKADITVLDKDIFKVDLKDIRDVKVCLTFVDGKPVYSALE